MEYGLETKALEYSSGGKRVKLIEMERGEERSNNT